MINKISNLIINNIAYQYLGEAKDQSSYKLLLVFLRDLFIIERLLKKCDVKKNIIVMTDTDAAGITEYIKKISLHTQLKTDTIIIKKRKIKDINALIDIIFWTIRQLGIKPVLKFKFTLQFRKSPLKLINLITLDYLTKNNFLFEKIFNGRRCIVFYEKSILSMIGYLYSSRFEVIQHGNPTETYWPSLAQIYYVWSPSYRKLITEKCNSQVRICGYPGDIEQKVQFKEAKFDILFLSQYGSSPELINECRQVKQYINSLAARNLKIIVKPHPREKEYDLQFSPGITIAGPKDKMEDLFSICTSVCSYYSTGLLLAAHHNCAVFRITLDARSLIMDFPFLNDIPPISATDTQTNPLTIAKKIKTDIQEFNYHAFV